MQPVIYKVGRWLRTYVLTRGGLLSVLCVSVIFLSVALISYNPTDATWLYATTDNTFVGNWAGSLGAHGAALLFYLFGAASYGIIMTLLLVGYLVWLRIPLRAAWERIVAGFIFTSACATLAAVYKIDLFGAPYPGGVVGSFLRDRLTRYFDYVSLQFVAYTLIAVALLLFFHISFITVGRYSLAVANFFMSRERFWRPAYVGAQKVVAVCMVPWVALGSFVRRVYVGTAIPDEDYALDVYEPGLAEDEPSEHILNQSKPSGCVQECSASNFVKKSGLSEKKSDAGERSEEKDDNYHLPDTALFVRTKGDHDTKQMRAELEARARVLEEKLERFGVKGTITAIKHGPVVTVFEYQPGIDTKLSKILALEDDLALALRALSIRTLAPIPGRSVVGFEVANQTRQDVYLSTIIRSGAFQKNTGSLPLILGDDTIGEHVVVDLAKMPHVLIAGSTGSGKSVALNAMLISLLCRRSPDELKLILIDPKRLEFASYADIAHLIFPIITDPKRATMALRWVVQEMEERYETMAAAGARNIFDYHTMLGNKHAMPYIVVVIDELADLMMTTGRDCEELITRITQMARAAGIHLIVATQRPSVDVITGLIKVNFPSRISFRVTSKIDSRTILDSVGADKLLGRGDMLFLDAGGATMRRVHGAYVSDKEIEQVVAHIKAERSVAYRDLHEEVSDQQGALLDADDELYTNVIDFLEQVDEVSISLLQRRFRIGYNRSARIIDILETQGMIMPADGSKTRKVIRSR